MSLQRLFEFPKLLPSSYNKLYWLFLIKRTGKNTVKDVEKFIFSVKKWSENQQNKLVVDPILTITLARACKLSILDMSYEFSLFLTDSNEKWSGQSKLF